MNRSAALLGGLLFAALPVYAQDPAPPNVTAAVTAPAVVNCSATFTSTITLTGFNNEVPGTADIMFVIDESGSIDSIEWNQLDNFVDSTVNALDLASTGNRVGIVKYSSFAQLRVPLTNNALALTSQPRTFPGGSTATDQGILLADQHLRAFARPDASKFIIVLTDGFSSTGQAALNQASTNAKNAGATLIAVGVAAANVNELNLIASDIPGVDTTFFVSEFAQLQTLVGSLIESIVTPGATNVTVSATAMPRFPIIGAAATAGSVSLAGGQVTWTLPALGASTPSLTMTHTHDGTGNGPLQIFSAAYADLQAHVVSIDSPSADVTGCNTAPTANAGDDRTVPLAGTSASVTLNGSGSSDDGLVQPLSYAWTSDTGVVASGMTPSVVLPLGVHVFTLTVNDGEFSAQDTVVITVVDGTAPIIEAVTPSVSELGPANHKIVPVSLVVDATDNTGVAPVCVITSATSSESDNGLGDGDMAGDVTITGPLTVALRSERSGQGTGRTYTVGVTCTDAAGNASAATTTIFVPKTGRGR